MTDLNKMTDWERLKGIIKDTEFDSQMRDIDETAFIGQLLSRVKGQDEIVKDVARLIRLNWFKEQRRQPICNLLFLGPTGTGKTELAKAIGEYLYEDEKNIIRFDCSELASPDMAKARLTGSSVGFVGSEMGGQLTRPMFANPRRVVLFDEIEKAHPQVFDLFLQMMGEGRLSEQGSGNTADFTQAIVVLTSNAHAEEIAKVTKGITDYRTLLNAIKSYLADAKVFRPEILGRLDRVCVFKPLLGIVIAEISLLKIARMGKDYGIEVKFVAPELVARALEANHKVSRFGIRELERILFDIFAPSIVAAREKKIREVSFGVDSGGQIVSRYEEPGAAAAGAASPPAPAKP